MIWCQNPLRLYIQVSQTLTHSGRARHICVSKLVIIGSDNGMSSDRRQAIISTNTGIVLIGPLGTNFSEILIEIHTFSFKKMLLKMSSGKGRPFCLGLNVLNPSRGIHYIDVIMRAMASQITSLTIVYSTAYSGADQRKHQSFRVTGLCAGNSPVTGEFPAQRTSNAENVSIWWRHHDKDPASLYDTHTASPGHHQPWHQVFFSGSRHSLSVSKRRHFLKNSRLWVENECCCSRTEWANESYDSGKSCYHIQDKIIQKNVLTFCGIYTSSSYIFTHHHTQNILIVPSWCHSNIFPKSWSTLDQVMACCLKAISHSLIQCGSIIDNITRNIFQ